MFTDSFTPCCGYRPVLTVTVGSGGGDTCSRMDRGDTIEELNEEKVEMNSWADASITATEPSSDKAVGIRSSFKIMTGVRPLLVDLIFKSYLYAYHWINIYFKTKLKKIKHGLIFERSNLNEPIFSSNQNMIIIEPIFDWAIIGKTIIFIININIIDSMMISSSSQDTENPLSWWFAGSNDSNISLLSSS
jgi:hypothetical protein